MKHVGIVLSAGKGLRVGGNIPKQYMELAGKPVLYYSLKAMQDCFIDEIILVSGKEDVEFCRKEIVKKYGFDKVKAIVPGGAERSDSVFEGLKAIENIEDAYVYVQDGARPLLSEEIMNRAREAVTKYGACACGVKSKDTVKYVTKEGFVESTPTRDCIRIIQTPQAFLAKELFNAYECLKNDKDAFVTDDASVIEKYGKREVYVFEGDYSNIKITTSDDFGLAEKKLKIN